MAPKKKVMKAGETCTGCTNWCYCLWGIAAFLVGVFYLGQDLGWAWTSFWKLNWWTSAFLLLAWKMLCCKWKR